MSNQENIKSLLSEGLETALQGNTQSEPVTVVEENTAPPAIVMQSEPVISETFEAMLQETGVSQAAPSEISPLDVLKGIQFDLSSIEIITDVSELDLIQNEDVVLQTKKTMQIVACQSSYAAEVSALGNQEVQNVSDSNVDFYNYKKKLYKAVWNHIEGTSVGKMDFATWMKVTSYFDLETFLYGVYCQTFPYQNKYTLRCPKPQTDCGKTFDVTINNATLVETRGRDAEIYSKINEIVASIKHSQDLVANSHVHTTKRISAKESKMVFDIKIPSVFDYLEGILGNVNEQFAEEFSQSLGVALFIDKIFIPNVVNYERTGRLTFMEVSEKGKIIDILSKMSFYDGSKLAEDINEFTDKFRVTYSIKDVGCPHCGLALGEIPMNMEEVLFTVIRQGPQENNE